MSLENKLTDEVGRDIFDCTFLMNKRITINKDIIKIRTGLELSECLDNCKQMASEVKPNRILNGLGELIDEVQKKNIKDNLVKDFIFHCNLLQQTNS
jgi:hypothetical protein